MLNTERFIMLENRLAELRSNMLPEEFSPTGDYSERELDEARGYRLLAHAEIESYLEERSRAAILNSVRNWIKHKKPSKIVFSLISSYHICWDLNPATSDEETVKLLKKRAKITNSIDELVQDAANKYIKATEDNHGVREKNIRTLLTPLGIDLSDLDNEWKVNLDNFGKKKEVMSLIGTKARQFKSVHVMNMI